MRCLVLSRFRYNKKKKFNMKDLALQFKHTSASLCAQLLVKFRHRDISWSQNQLSTTAKWDGIRYRVALRAVTVSCLAICHHWWRAVIHRSFASGVIVNNNNYQSLGACLSVCKLSPSLECKWSDSVIEDGYVMWLVLLN